MSGLKLLQWNRILDRILAKCTDVWGKITPMKRAVQRLHPNQEVLPHTVKNFTQMPYLWHFATLLEQRSLLLQSAEKPLSGLAIHKIVQFTNCASSLVMATRSYRICHGISRRHTHSVMPLHAMELELAAVTADLNFQTTWVPTRVTTKWLSSPTFLHQ